MNWSDNDLLPEPWNTRIEAASWVVIVIAIAYLIGHVAWAVFA